MYALSKKSKYAFRALIMLARQYDHGPILIWDIAEKVRL